MYQRTERAPRTYFQQQERSLLEQRAHALGEAHSLAQMLTPILWVCSLLYCNPCASDIRNERDLRRLETKPLHLLYKRFLDSIHVLRMSGHVQVQHLALLPPGAQVMSKRFNRGPGSRHNATTRSIAGSQRKVGWQTGADLFFGEGHTQHCSGWQLLKEQ